MRRTTSVFALLILFLCLACLPVFALDTDTFGYQSLSGTEQIAYEAMTDCITHLIPSWNCGSLGQEVIQKAYDCIMMDHPEYFWTDSYTYVTSYVNNSITGHRVEFTYSMDAAQIKRRNNELTQALYAMVDDMSFPDTSQYTIVKTVFDYLVDNCTYDELNLDQSMYSVMINRSGVCASFSKAFEFIIQCLGIPCTVVYGRLTQNEGVLSTTLGHEWNIVCIDGKWYHVDVTSGLAVDASGELERYRFLCTTTEEILKTHLIENPVPIPVCDSPDLEFFVMNDLTVETYSREAVARVMLKAMDMGYMPVVRFASYRAFSEAVDDLFTNEGIFQAIRETTGLEVQTINYQIDEERLLIRLDTPYRP